MESTKKATFQDVTKFSQAHLPRHSHWLSCGIDSKCPYFGLKSRGQGTNCHCRKWQPQRRRHTGRDRSHVWGGQSFFLKSTGSCLHVYKQGNRRRVVNPAEEFSQYRGYRSEVEPAVQKGDDRIWHTEGVGGVQGTGR